MEKEESTEAGLRGWVREQQDRFWKSDFGQSLVEAGIELLHVPKSVYDSRLAKDLEELSDKCSGHLKGACENLFRGFKALRPRGFKSILDSAIEGLEKKRRPREKVKTIKIGK